MEYTTRPGLDIKTAFVSSACLLGAAVGGYYLYQDLNVTGAKGIGKPLAKVERREAKVRRKLPSSYVWTQVQQEEELYRKDSLQTGPGSAASVKFADGSVLEVGEESLIIIDDIQNLSLNFVRGSAIVRKATGDARITAGKDGKAKVEELPVQLLSPPQLSSFYTVEGASKSVTFSWRSRQDKEQKQTLQISPDKAFRPARTQAFTPDRVTTTELAAALRPGRYFWRVVTEGSSGAPVVRELRISSVAALRPVWPAQGRQMVTWTNEASVSFRWASPEGRAEDTGEHRLELSKDPGFKTVQLSESVRAENAVANLKGVAEGTWHWRLRSRYADVSLTGPSEKFVVERGARIPIELAFPADKSSFELQPRSRFIWNAESAEAEYQIEVQEAATQKQVATGRGRIGSFVWDKPAPGAYRWRVTAYMQNHPAGESPWRAFTVFKGQPLALKAPAVGRELRYWDKPPVFDFEWTQDSLGQESGNTYQLELSTDPQFRAGVVSKSLKSTRLSSAELALAPGNYSWRVRVVDRQGTTLKISEVSRFQLGLHPPVRAPAQIQVPGAVAETFNVLEQRKNPVLSWEPIPDATGYEVTLTQGGKVLLQKTIQDTKLELKGLREGDYAWAVRSIDRLNRKSDVATPGRLKLTYGQVLEAPEELTAEVQ